MIIEIGNKLMCDHEEKKGREGRKRGRKDNGEMKQEEVNEREERTVIMEVERKKRKTENVNKEDTIRSQIRSLKEDIGRRINDEETKEDDTKGHTKRKREIEYQERKTEYSKLEVKKEDEREEI